MSSFFVQSLLLPISWIDQDPDTIPNKDLVGIGTFAFNMATKSLYTTRIKAGYEPAPGGNQGHSSNLETELIVIGEGRPGQRGRPGLVKISEGLGGNSDAAVITEAQMLAAVEGAYGPSNPVPQEILDSVGGDIDKATPENPVLGSATVGELNDGFGLFVTYAGDLLALGESTMGGLGSGSATITANGNRTILIPGYDRGDYISVKRGHHCVFVLMNDNTLWGWGDNSNGVLGTGDTVDSFLPVKIADGVMDYWVNRKAVNGQGNVLVYATADDLYVVGNGAGSINDPTVDFLTPTVIPTHGGLTSNIKLWIFGGLGGKNLYLQDTVSKDLFVMGVNRSGELGTGDTNPYLEWELVGTLPEEDIVDIHCGLDHTDGLGLVVNEGFATILLAGGKIYSAGVNNKYQLGIGTTTDSLMWTATLYNEELGELTDFQSIHGVAGSKAAMFGVDSTGQLYTWGWWEGFTGSLGTILDGHGLARPAMIDWRTQLGLDGTWTIEELAIADGEVDNDTTKTLFLLAKDGSGNKLLAACGTYGKGLVASNHNMDMDILDGFKVCYGIPEHNNITSLSFGNTVVDESGTNVDNTCVFVTYNHGEVWVAGAGTSGMFGGLFGSHVGSLENPMAKRIL